MTFKRGDLCVGMSEEAVPSQTHSGEIALDYALYLHW